MGTVYKLLNKTKKERVSIDGVGLKFFELMARRYSNMVVWLLLENWQGDYVVLVNDNNSIDYGTEFYNSKDKTEEYNKLFEEFVKDNKWYFDDELKRDSMKYVHQKVEECYLNIPFKSLFINVEHEEYCLKEYVDDLYEKHEDALSKTEEWNNMLIKNNNNMKKEIHNLKDQLRKFNHLKSVEHKLNKGWNK